MLVRYAILLAYVAASCAAFYFFRSYLLLGALVVGVVPVMALTMAFLRIWRSVVPQSETKLISQITDTFREMHQHALHNTPRYEMQLRELPAIAKQIFGGGAGSTYLYRHQLPFDLRLAFMPRYVIRGGSSVYMGDLEWPYFSMKENGRKDKPGSLVYNLLYPLGLEHGSMFGATKEVQPIVPAIHRYFEGMVCPHTGYPLTVEKVKLCKYHFDLEGAAPERRSGKGDTRTTREEMMAVHDGLMWVQLKAGGLPSDVLLEASANLKDLPYDPSLAVTPVLASAQPEGGKTEEPEAEALPDRLSFVDKPYPEGHLSKGHVYFGESFSDTSGGYWVPIDKLTHVVVTGTSGYGKSTFLHQIMRGLLYNAEFFEQLYMVDLKGGVELWKYNGEGDGRCTVVYEFDSLCEIVQNVCDLMDRRLDEMRERGIRDYDGGKILFVIEEYGSIQLEAVEGKEGKAKKEKLLMNLTKLATKARAAGVIIWAQLQKGTSDVMDSSFRANIQTEIMFRVKSKLVAAQAFGTTEDLIVDPTVMLKGQFVMYDASRGKIAYLQSRVVNEVRT